MAVMKLLYGRHNKDDGILLPNGGKKDPEPDTFHLQYTPHAESPSEAIVRAVSFVRNVDHDELQPLANTIDPGAVDRLLDASGSEYVEITFEYQDLEVTANNDQDIWLQWI